MPSVQMAESTHWIGVNDRTTDLFEGVWPITQEGVSYNAYAIRDEQNVLVDLTREFKTAEYMDLVQQVFPVEKTDCIIVNHSEPDHTGALPAIRERAPEAVIRCTPKAAEMLKNFYGIEDGVQPVEDGEILHIGNHELQFHHTPFLHWPDTMMTYDATTRVLFSCDAFGAYGALPGSIFDDDCTDMESYEKQALRYFATVVSKYSHMIPRTLKKMAEKELAPLVIAPGHGRVWRKDPARVVDWYRKWAEYHAGAPEQGVTLLYGSMYGNTEKYMNAFAQGASSSGLPVEVFDVAKTHSGLILPAVLKYQAVVLNVPTYEGGLFPPAAHILDMIARKNIKARDVAIFGSYLWSGGAQKEFQAIIEKLKWNLMDSGEFRGASKRGDLDRAFEAGRAFAAGLSKRSAA